MSLPSEPITRKEQYLAKAAGQAVEIPAEPITREEAYLDAIAKGSGGGGGTSDYSQLTNKPQINGTTLTGNKSASDLSLASTADLAGKVDKVDGKGLSTNDYTDADKAIVGGVTAALAGKQDALTAGDYIEIDGNEISVNPVVPNEEATYQIVSDGQEGGTYFVRINKIVNGEVVLTERYYTESVTHNFDNVIQLDYAKTVGWSWTYKLLVASTTHDAEYTYSWGYTTQVDIDEVVVLVDHSGESLVLKSQMDTALAGKQDTLTFDSVPTDGSTNPVESNGVYDALALKQDKTDNTLQTTDKTVVGGINELKSGLTTLDNEVNGDATTYPYADVITIEDAVPSNLADCTVKIEPVQDLHGFDKPWVGGAGKNKLPLVLADIKAANTTGTWNGNVYTINQGTITVSVDDADNIIGFVVNGTFSSTAKFNIFNGTFSAGSYKITGGINNGLAFGARNNAGSMVYSTGSEVAYNLTEDKVSCDAHILIGADTFADRVLYPMIRLATETDATFAPYTNYCPITGHTEVEVQRDGGKNLLNVNAPDVIVGKTVLYDGTLIEAEHVNVSGYIYVKDSAVLTYTSKTYNVYAFNRRIVCYDENKQFLGTCVQTTDTPTGIVTITGTVLANTKYVRVPFARDDASAEQLEYGTQATTYQPYQGKTYTITLGDTIYGGTVDFDSGVMTVDRAIDTLTSLNRTNDHSFYKPPTTQAETGQTTIDKVLCDRLPTGNIEAEDSLFINNSGNVRINTTQAFSTAEEAMAYLGGSYTLTYRIATPFTVQLTPQQIQLLKGQNTLTASTGQISVTVNGVSGAIGQVQTQANATDEALAELAADIAEQLPTAPTTDGAYVLTVTVADGTPTYSWESAT